MTQHQAGSTNAPPGAGQPPMPPPSPRNTPPRGPRCYRCGYDLTGFLGTNCPECNALIYTTSPATSGWAIASLIMGIMALISCTAYGFPALLFGPLAIWFAAKAKDEVATGTASPGSLGLANAGRVCGLIGLLIGVLVLAVAAVGLVTVKAFGP